MSGMIPCIETPISFITDWRSNYPGWVLRFCDVFLEKSANVLLERTSANELTIELEEGKQPPYGPIYSLEPLELKTFKTYIETNLANGFIQVLKSLVGIPILFVCKPNGSLRLCVNY